jgi:hypothetical protein
LKEYLAPLLVVCLAGALAAEDITPRIGVVQIFGAEKGSRKKIQSAVKAEPGDPLPHTDEIEARLSKVSGVVSSSVQAVCCWAHNMVLYVGVQEKDSPHMAYHAVPTGDQKLPGELWDKYNAVIAATEASLHAHNADEDLTSGYSLLADPAGRELQGELLPLVAANLSTIDSTVRNSGDSEQRAAAAYLLQYTPRTPREIKTMTDALQFAIQDSDSSVRSNAMVALKAVLVGARLHPAQHIRIEPTWFVELMNSEVWSDRRNASLALVTLTDKGNLDTLSLIRERALGAVCDMAAWQDLEHALPGFILAGRIAGMSKKDIDAAWVSGDREPVIRAARESARKKH